MQSKALESLVKVLNGSRISIRKRAVPALSALVATDPKLFGAVKTEILKGLSSNGESGRIWVAVVASFARGQTVGKVGALVGEGQLIGMILGQCENPEETDTVEGALAVSPLSFLRTGTTR